MPLPHLNAICLHLHDLLSSLNVVYDTGPAAVRCHEVARIIEYPIHGGWNSVLAVPQGVRLDQRRGLVGNRRPKANRAIGGTRQQLLPATVVRETPDSIGVACFTKKKIYVKISQEHVEVELA